MREPILVIDDEWRLVAVLRERLDAAGFAVHATLSAEDGLHMAREHRPKIILVDICMAGVDGYEFCRRLRSDSEIAHTPIIALSAVAHDSARHAILDAGANCFISKPYDIKNLLQKIEILSNGRRQGDFMATPMQGVGEAT
jgi:DNA-binding response OmpR family regulator